ncbi:aquaporin-9-like, partial [Oppia nitens]|uniref:aquaporin-9-like n=1 Tax=Oppia nitens TaxID=1686743 RepID=UPI0023D98BE9
CGLFCGRRPKWLREFFAEFFGTYFIIAFGDGAIANYLLNKDNKLGVDHFAVCLAFGVGVMVGVAIASKISGAHLNPAVTVALASCNKFPVRKIPLYLLAQYLGAFAGAFSIFLAYYEAIDAYDSGHRIPYRTNTTGAVSMATGGIFSTYPAAHVSLTGSLVDQIVATSMLLFAVMAITDPGGLNTPKPLEPPVLALLITGICIAFGLNCGAVLNPARDLGPRFFQLLAGYGYQAFKPVQCLYWLTAGVIGPHIGGILGAWTYMLTISGERYVYDDDDDDDGDDDIGSDRSDSRRQQRGYKLRTMDTLAIGGGGGGVGGGGLDVKNNGQSSSSSDRIVDDGGVNQPLMSIVPNLGTITTNNKCIVNLETA